MTTPHILVTNDDGVSSPGLLALKQALESYGRVSVIAPDSKRSAIGRGITIHNPLHVDEVRLADGSEALATDGTPVECVRFDFGGPAMTSGGTCELDCRRPDASCPDGMECIQLSMDGGGGVAICDYFH